MISLIFKAVGKELNGWKYGKPRTEQYDASFTIDFDPTKVNQVLVNAMIQEQTQLFNKYHPNGRILQQMQRQY